MKKLLVMTFLISALGYAAMPTVNYDDQFDNEEINTINENIVDDVLLGLELESLTFQEQRVKSEDGKTITQNIPVSKVKQGEKIVYINRLINPRGEVKRSIVVKNPIPNGTKYIHGSAICDQGCKVSYSTNQGITLETDEDTTQSYDYLEFHFYKVPASSEVRMGFRAIVE